MDFFKSVFSNDPDPSNPREKKSLSESPHKPQEEDEQGEEKEEEEEETSDNPSPNSPSGGGEGSSGGVWSFGGIIKTLASKSESVIQTYRRDLEEFGSGLKKETAAIKEVATRAVRELPGSLEVGASVAQESLETVGQAVDEFGGSVWRGTTDIISHGKEAFLSMESEADPSSSDPGMQNPAGSSKRYSRFEVQVLAIQSDPATFSEEPDDAEDYQKWKLGFELAEEEEEIENLLYENGVLEGFFEKLVPDVVNDQDTFWSRYYYRVYKLKQSEDARANLVKRAISREEDEDLSWEVDEDDEEVEKKEVKVEIREVNKEEEIKKEIVESSESVEENLEVSMATPDVAIPSTVGEGDKAGPNGDSASNTQDKMIPDAKSDPGESCKDSDVSVVSSQPSMQEEDDLGWDEIEDLGEHDEKKVGGSGASPERVDLLKRLSAAEEDEDLNWDIEDDDEPVKP